MKTRWLFIVPSLLLMLGLSSPAIAVPTFTGDIYFNGACDDCSAGGGAGTATATISVTNYTWGDSLPGGVPFSYHSDLLGTLTPYLAHNVTGSFDSANSAAAAIYLDFEIFGSPAAGFYTFETFGDGAWNLTKTIGSEPADYGFQHTWSATQTNGQQVPEPETYSLVLAALGVMGFVARRRKQEGAV